MTKEDDPRLEGRHPEFTRMSLRPGIGAGFTDEMASTLLEYRLDDEPDVPNAVRVGAGIMPIGRYLRRNLRARIGRDVKTPPETINEMVEELRPLRESAFSAALPGQKYDAFREAIIASGEGRRIQLEHKYRSRKRGSL